MLIAKKIKRAEKGIKMTRATYSLILFFFLIFCPHDVSAVNNYCPDFSDQELSMDEVQLALSILGYYEGQITGQYDEKTIKAIKRFQSELGLAVDGLVKYHLWVKLAQMIESKEIKTSAPKLSPPSGEVSIVIDVFRRKLIVMNDQHPYAQFPIAIGKSDTPSPLGHWKIVNKSVNWGNGFGTRWMGLNVPWGVYGIHGTNKPWSIGSLASHGCFRMFNKDVETIYPWIKHGTNVFVLGNPFSYMSGGIQKLHVGMKSPAVTYIQEKLILKGFYQGAADGLFGPGTEQAVKKLQEYNQLTQNGQVGYQEYEALGIMLK
ncbi:MAG: L,D-transpeptidase family protein [Peptococcia bacterium]|jgi:peptidoglycan hydrolase-like protein with peptidoglycan-binding domain